MTTLHSLSQPRLAAGCRLREMEGEPATLLFPEGILRLKGPGAEILRRCDGQRTFAEIVAEIQAQYRSADPRLIEHDIESFLDRLQNRRVIDL